MLLADVICHVVVIWLMISAIVTDGIVTFFVIVADGKTTFEITDNVVTVTDGKSHVNG